MEDLLFNNVAKSISREKMSFTEKQKMSKRVANILNGHSHSTDSDSHFSQITENRNGKICRYDPDWSQYKGKYASDITESHDEEADFLREILGILLDYIRKMRSRDTKVLDFHQPHRLKETLEHCFDLPKSPKDLEELLSDCREALKYCVKTGHSRYFNQLTCGIDSVALAGEFLTATANTNMYTYEVAPVFTLMEEVMLRRLREFIGWSSGDGILSPGGTISNLYAVLVARHMHYQTGKNHGLYAGPRLVIYTSEQAHYSIKKAAIICGLGLENVRLIKTDKRGKMSTDHLLEEIQRSINAGHVPCMVSATCGTTVLGAFDPIEEIAEICESYGIWFHVDCAWGGGALLSEKHRYLLKGLHRADSVTWNPHKAMTATLQCSAILMRKEGILQNCNGLNPEYLFQKDKCYDVAYDTGDKAIQCSRKNDVFKLWLMWRAKGDQGFEAQIDRLFSLTDYLCRLIRSTDGFEMVLEKPEYLNVCFWYVPTRYRLITDWTKKKAILHEVTARIKGMMLEHGTMMVSYQPLSDKPNFFRMVIVNPSILEDDLDFALKEIQRLGEEIIL